MLKAVIIDDELPGIVSLRIMLERLGGQVKIVGEATAPAEGIELIEKHQPDVVFLDISMPEMSGFELLERLDYRDFKLVFTTAHREYAISAIKNRAFDYLLKPVAPEDLVKCLNNIKLELSPEKKKKSSDLIELQVKDGIIFIRQKEIVRLEADGSYTIFFMENGTKHIASKNLKEYFDLLSPAVFYRCHQSHVINLSKVDRLIQKDGLYIRMNEGSMVNLSRKNRVEFLERLKSF
jgi:two-component system LytT family response regulator